MRPHPSALDLARRLAADWGMAESRAWQILAAESRPVKKGSGRT